VCLIHVTIEITCVTVSFYKLYFVYFWLPLVIWWLIRYSFNGVGHINKVKLRRARLVLESVTFGESTILVFIQATQAYLAWSSLFG